MEASYTITNNGGFLIARDDESGEVVARVVSETMSNASTDSHSAVSEFGSALVGEIISVDHDGDTIHVAVRIPASIGITPR